MPHVWQVTVDDRLLGRLKHEILQYFSVLELLPFKVVKTLYLGTLNGFLHDSHVKWIGASPFAMEFSSSSLISMFSNFLM